MPLRPKPAAQRKGLTSCHMPIHMQTFDAWRAARYGSVAKQQILRRAIARLQVRTPPSKIQQAMPCKQPSLG